MEKFIGVGIMVASIVFYAILTPLQKKVNADLPPFTIMAISMFVLFFFSFLGSVIFEHGFSIKPDVIKSNLTPLILVGVFNFFAFWFFILGFKYFPVWQQQMFFLLMPIFGGILAFFMLGEALSPKLFIGLAIIAVGLFVGLR